MRKTLCCVIITAVLSAVFGMALLLRPVPLESGPVDLNLVADGEYVGICQNRLLFAVVRVAVRGHRMTGIKVGHVEEPSVSNRRLFLPGAALLTLSLILPQIGRWMHDDALLVMGGFSLLGLWMATPMPPCPPPLSKRCKTWKA